MGCLRISVNHQHNRLGSIKPFRTSLIITILKKFQFRKVLFLKFLLEVRSKILASPLQISLFSIVKFFSFVFSANFNVVDVTYYFVPLTQFNEPTDSLISPFITVWLRPEECERLFIRKNRLWRSKNATNIVMLMYFKLITNKFFSLPRPLKIIIITFIISRFNVFYRCRFFMGDENNISC